MPSVASRTSRTGCDIHWEARHREMTMTQVQAYTAQPNGLVVPAQRRQQGLSIMTFGHMKQGKTSWGDTGPAPRFILDVENAAYWTPSRKIYWNPLRETVP